MDAESTELVRAAGAQLGLLYVILHRTTAYGLCETIATGSAEFLIRRYTLRTLRVVFVTRARVHQTVYAFYNGSDADPFDNSTYEPGRLRTLGFRPDQTPAGRRVEGIEEDLGRAWGVLPEAVAVRREYPSHVLPLYRGDPPP